MSHRVLLLGLSLALLGGCPWKGPEDLIKGATLEVVLTGANPEDRVRLVLDGASSVYVVREPRGEPVRLYAALSPGAHEGLFELSRGAARFCERFEVEIQPGAREVLSFDARFLPRCGVELPDAGPPRDAGPPPDAGRKDDAGDEDAGDDDGGDEPDDAPDAGPEDDGGELDDADDEDDGGELDDAGDEPDGAGAPPERHLRLFEERVVRLYCSMECEERTIVHDDGTLEIEGSEDFSGVVSEADFDVFAEEALSEAADRLFAGEDPSCPTQQPPEGEQVTLTRRVEGPDDEDVTESVDVSGCTGIASRLRARLDFLRDVAEAPVDAGLPEGG